jgi:HK97 family phage major capsid protein
MNRALLLQKQAEARAKARAIHTKATAEGRLTTPEEDEQFRAHMAEANSYDAKIADCDALLALERVAPAIAAAAAQRDTVVAITRQPLSGRDIVVERGDNALSKPFASLGEQLYLLRAGTLNPRDADIRIQAALGSSEGVASDGGILVDPQFAPGIMQRTYEESVLADRCMSMPMARASMKVKAVDEKSRVDGSRFGGIQSFWEGEAEQYQASKAKFRTMDVVAHKLTCLIYQTEEELEDIPFLEAYNNETVPLELGFKLDQAIAVGTGAGMPLGFSGSPATIVVAKDAGQATGTVSTTNILNMLTRMYARSLKTAAFFVNPALIWTQLATLTIGTGTAVKLIYQGPSPEAPYGSIFGVPVIPIEQAAAVGSQGDIILADLKTYMLAKRQGIRADSSIHVAFLTGEIAFRWMTRVDGQPTWNSPLTPANGSITTSPYVVLAARP